MPVYVSNVTAGVNAHPTPASRVMPYVSDRTAPGILIGLGVEPQTVPNMSVKIRSGAALIAATPTSESRRNFRLELSADYDVTINSNSSGVTQYDVIYFEPSSSILRDPPTSGDLTEVSIIKVSRSTTQNAIPAGTNVFVLAEVTVPNGASSITGSSISHRAESAYGGWLTAPTAVRTSNTTMTVTGAGDMRRFLSNGSRLRWREGATAVWKYAYIVGSTYTSPVATITIFGDTMAVSPLELQVNYDILPFGFPETFAYAVTATVNISGTPTTNAWRLSLLPSGLAHLYGTYGGGVSATSSATCAISLPIPASRAGVVPVAQYPPAIGSLSGLALRYYIPGNSTGGLGSTANFLHIRVENGNLPTAGQTLEFYGPIIYQVEFITN